MGFINSETLENFFKFEKMSKPMPARREYQVLNLQNNS